MCAKLMPTKNGPHFADNTFQYIFLNKSVWIQIKISPTFVPRCPINSILALVQMMAWRQQAPSHLVRSVFCRCAVFLSSKICVICYHQNYLVAKVFDKMVNSAHQLRPNNVLERSNMFTIESTQHCILWVNKSHESITLTNITICLAFSTNRD